MNRAVVRQRVEGSGEANEKSSFGVTPDGSAADLCALTNKNGPQVSITDCATSTARIYFACCLGGNETRTAMNN
jgi:hypothetical protein